MTTKLADLLIAVAGDPDRLAAFLADPEPEMEDAHLTAAEKDAVRDRDTEKIERLMGEAGPPNWASACWMAAPHGHKPPRAKLAPQRRPAKPPARRHPPARGRRPGAARKPKRGRSRRGR